LALNSRHLIEVAGRKKMAPEQMAAEARGAGFDRDALALWSLLKSCGATGPFAKRRNSCGQLRAQSKSTRQALAKIHVNLARAFNGLTWNG